MIESFEILLNKQLLQKIEKLDKGFATPKLLTLLGIQERKWMQENFKRSGQGSSVFSTGKKWKKLAAFTIARRRQGSSLPLLDTRRNLFSQIEYRTGAKSVSLGIHNRIAEQHEKGTSRIPARPMLPTKALGERIAINALERLLEKLLK